METTCDELTALLLVDDDTIFCKVLCKALENRGFKVIVAHRVEQAITLVHSYQPELAVVDLKMNGASGLTLVKVLHELDPATRIVMLTDYASIATAVEAIKLVATQYLVKPANVDETLAAFGHLPNPDLAFNAQPASVDRLEWEHDNRVLHENGGNIFAIARALKMHRRCLQRKLSKQPDQSI